MFHIARLSTTESLPHKGNNLMHHLVDLALHVATTVEPKRRWRVIGSDDHSTVWDGKDTLWDLNYTALGIDPDEAFKIATK
ncbi:MAG: hypothetical protein QNL51_10635 [Opitutaceae bacterium]|tara:strand:- start:170 stop:412 length:243 start_codon:yes stop_codon:yes gene_type:complete